MLYDLVCRSAELVKGKSKVRHIYHMPNSEGVLHSLESEKDIAQYQRYQNLGRKIGKMNDLSISWVCIGGDRYVYAGLYRNMQDREEIVRYDGWQGADYDCRKVSGDCDSLIGKLVITVDEKIGRSWVRLNPVNVSFEIVQDSAIGYPGHDEVVIEYMDLKQAVLNPAYREAWAHVWAVYRWVNMKDGRAYIGSACGENGLLQRMEDYASWSHGNLILGVVKPEVMKLSIIYAVDKDYVTKQEILEKEYREIEKAMTYLHGYNHGGLEANRKRIDRIIQEG